MMGRRQVEQAALFYEFSLERHVPPDHLLRSIDRFVALGELRRELAPFYSAIGLPSVDPELMIRMLIVGYSFCTRSERRLCDEVHLNLAYRWFCRLGLDGDVPAWIPVAGYAQIPAVPRRFVELVISTGPGTERMRPFRSFGPTKSRVSGG